VSVKFNSEIKICATDESGKVLFEFSLSDMQKDWDNDPNFGSEGMKVSVKDLAKAVGEELALPYYSEFGK